MQGKLLSPSVMLQSREQHLSGEGVFYVRKIGKRCTAYKRQHINERVILVARFKELGFLGGGDCSFCGGSSLCGKNTCLGIKILSLAHLSTTT